MRIFLTERKYREAVMRESSDPARDPAFIVHRYSENPKLLKAARAAFENVSVDAIDKLYVDRAERAVEPMKRAIKAFAEGLAAERSEL